MFSTHGAFFGFVTLWTLLSVAFVIIVVMLIVRAVNHAQRLRSEAVMAMIQKGVYDPRLLEPQPAGVALLGWGIALISVGAAIIVGLLIIDRTGGMIGGLIPLFLGVGLIVTYTMVRRSAAGEKRVAGPVRFSNERSHSENTERQPGPHGTGQPQG